MRRMDLRGALAQMALFLFLTPAIACSADAPATQGLPWPDPGGVPVPADLDLSRIESQPSADGGADAPPLGAWNVLILLYRNLDATYGSSRYSAAMSNAQVAMLQNASANYASIASTWSSGLGSVQYTLRVVERPIATITPVFTDFFWITPQDVATELGPELAAARYDSVIALWDSGSAPTNDGGLADVGPFTWNGHRFTWSTVLRGQDWFWSLHDAPGEVILHEWLHGVEGHYRNSTYVVPDLHGATDHGYAEDPGGSWRTWYKDYMQGKVVKTGWTRGISPAVWASGAVNSPVRPAPCQLLAPLEGTDAGAPPALAWAGPGTSFRMQLMNLADNSPAYDAVTTTKSGTPSQHVLRTDNRYRWQVVSQANGAESTASEAKTFRYTGEGVAYTMYQAAQALQIAAGLGSTNANWVGRLNIETSGPSAAKVDAIDAIRVVRKVAGLEPNP